MEICVVQILELKIFLVTKTAYLCSFGAISLGWSHISISCSFYCWVPLFTSGQAIVTLKKELIFQNL